MSKQSHRAVCKKGVLENFAKFIGKHLCRCLAFLRTLFFIEHVRAAASSACQVNLKCNRATYKFFSKLKTKIPGNVLDKFCGLSGQQSTTFFYWSSNSSLLFQTYLRMTIHIKIICFKILLFLLALKEHQDDSNATSAKTQTSVSSSILCLINFF